MHTSDSSIYSRVDTFGASICCLMVPQLVGRPDAVAGNAVGDLSRPTAGAKLITTVIASKSLKLGARHYLCNGVVAVPYFQVPVWYQRSSPVASLDVVIVLIGLQSLGVIRDITHPSKGQRKIIKTGIVQLPRRISVSCAVLESCSAWKTRQTMGHL